MISLLRRPLLVLVGILLSPLGIAQTRAPGTLTADAQRGGTLASGHFNNDGDEDLAIGAPIDTVVTFDKAGSVTILHGSADGLTATGNQLWNQDSPRNSVTAGVADEENAVDLARSLAPPAPNPKAGPTTVRYALAEAQEVQLVVVDLLGREVARLADGPNVLATMRPHSM